MTGPHAPLAIAVDDAALLQEIRSLLACDAFAASFQTMGSYRTFLLQHIRNTQETRRILANQPEKQKGI